MMDIVSKIAQFFKKLLDYLFFRLTWAHRRKELLKNLRERFAHDFLKAYDFYQDRCTAHISYKEYNTEKINYVKSWAKKNRLDPKPDDEQAKAIGAVEGHVQVVARAGSGKTATLVNRTLFLQKHCHVEPDDMLLLAFNRKAAEEMRNRLALSLGNSIPHVMTFHALAYAMVHPDEKILLDEPEGEQSLSSVVQNVINDYLKNPVYANKIRNFMMRRFRTNWEHRSSRRESLDGKYVKSFGEKVIANFLFEHDIKYIYEKKFWWDGINYRPDFTIFTEDKFNCGVVIEYFGLKGDPEYDVMTEKKRAYWKSKEPDWKLLDFYPDDLTDIDTLLKERLAKHGIPCNRLSDEKIWTRIKDHTINGFTKAVVQFIQRCRKLSLAPEQLSEKVSDRVKNPDCSDIEQDFLSLAQEFYKSYLGHLKSTKQDDFDGLMQEATKRVTAGETEFRYKSDTDIRTGNLKQIQYVLIDEYQDFSKLFDHLIQKIRGQNPHANFFCVGDDWQAINGFAGSDLHFFQNFSQVFQSSNQLHVPTNYRSAPAIVNVGNALMKGHGSGKPARAHQTVEGTVKIADLGTLNPTFQEETANPKDDLTPAVLRLVNKAITNNQNVVLLSRRNSLPWHVNYKDLEGKNALDRFLELVRAHFPAKLAEKITISTVHKYKGLEEDVVIVLDAVPRCYPLLHPNLVFTFVFGDSVESVTTEERRLFYVALTRAVKELFILTETNNSSSFLEDLKLPTLKWQDYPPLAYVTIKVGNQKGKGIHPTKAIKDLLKTDGYIWNGKTWNSTRLAEGFSVKEFVGQTGKTKWGKLANGIVAQFYDHLGNEIAKYHVDDGQWKYISGTIDNIPEPPVDEPPDDDIPF